MLILRPAVLVMLLCAGPPALAQTELTIAATGQAMVPPDEATASLTAQAQDASAAKAQASVNTAMARALALARAVPGVKAVTGDYNTNTVSTDNNTPPQFAAQQTLQLSLTAPDGVPPAAFSNLLGKLQQNGLLLNSLSGDLSSAGQRQAQQAAITDALTQVQSQAAAVADSLHEQVGAVKSVNVNAATPIYGPQPMMAMAMRAAPPPQSAPDNVQITASVTVDITLNRAQ